MSDADRTVLSKIRWPLRLTWAGLMAERITRAFWPVWSVIFAVAGLLMLGVHDMIAIELVWAMAVLSAAVLIGLTVRGALRFRFPARAEALDRLDSTMKGRPIQTLLDRQAIGAGDAGTMALWQGHQGGAPGVRRGASPRRGRAEAY